MAGFPTEYRTSLQPPGALGEPQQAGCVWVLEAKDSSVHLKEVRERSDDKDTVPFFHLLGAPPGLGGIAKRGPLPSLHTFSGSFCLTQEYVCTHVEQKGGGAINKLGAFSQAWDLQVNAVEEPTHRHLNWETTLGCRRARPA